MVSLATGTSPVHCASSWDKETSGQFPDAVIAREGRYVAMLDPCLAIWLGYEQLREVACDVRFGSGEWAD